MTAAQASRSRGSANDAEGRALAGLARSGTANLLGSGVSAVCQLLVVLTVTRIYSAEDAGALFAATSIFLIVVAVVEVGVDQGMVRFLAWHRARGEHSALHAILRIGIAPVIATSVLGGLVLFAAAGPLAEQLGGGSTGTIVDMLRVLALAVPLAAMNDIVLAATRGYGAMKPTVMIERIIRPSLQPIAIIVVGAAGGGLGALAVAWAGPYLVGTVLSALSLRRLRARTSVIDEAVSDPDQSAADTPVPVGIVPVGSSLTRAFWSYTSARAAARIFQVALQRMDVILVAALIGTRAAAVYTAATRFIAVGQLLSQAMQQVIQPRLAALLAVGDSRLAEVVLRRTTLWLVALAWPGYLAIIALAPWLMSVFGHGYESGAMTLVVLGIAMLAATATGPLDVVLLMAGRSTVSLYNMIAGLAVDLVGCLVLVRPLGVTGAAIAWAAAILVRNGLSIVMTKRMLAMSAWSHELVIVSGWALVYCAIVPVPLGLLDVSAAIVVPLVALGTLAYFATVWTRRQRLGLLTFDAPGRAAAGARASSPGTDNDVRQLDGPARSSFPRHARPVGRSRPSVSGATGVAARLLPTRSRHSADTPAELETTSSKASSAP